MKTIKSTDPDVLAFAGQQESAFLKTKDAWADKVVDIARGDVVALGDYLPWSKTHNVIRLRPGEVSIWAGINGHGKSMLTGQVALWLSRHSRITLASLEMKPESTLYRMTRQAAGCLPSPEYAEQFMRRDSDKVWVYDQLDTVCSTRILGMMHYCAKKLGTKHIFIDSLMKCGLDTDDYNGQKDFVDRLCWLAKTEDIHVHLIHHIRKPQSGGEGRRPNKFDVRGASEITDLVDNLFIVWRNKPKEALKRAGAKEYDPSAPDAVLACEKQRLGEWEGLVKLWFHPESQQFVSQPGRGAMPWPDPESAWGDLATPPFVGSGRQ